MSNLVNPHRFVTGGGGGFLPTDLANLEFWFDASDAASITESGGAVSQWDDISGNSGRDLLQATEARKPTLTTDGGFDSVLFDGSDNFMSSASVTISFTEMTFFMAYRQVSNTSTDFIFEAEETGSQNAIEFKQGSVNFEVFADASAGGNYAITVAAPKGTTTAAYIARATNNGNGHLEWDDGTENTDSSVGTLRTYGGVFSLAARDTGSSDANIHVHEFGFYSQDLSDTDKTTLMDYLIAKWGIT